METRMTECISTSCTLGESGTTTLGKDKSRPRASMTTPNQAWAIRNTKAKTCHDMPYHAMLLKRNKTGMFHVVSGSLPLATLMLDITVRTLLTQERGLFRVFRPRIHRTTPMDMIFTRDWLFLKMTSNLPSIYTFPEDLELSLCHMTPGSRRVATSGRKSANRNFAAAWPFTKRAETTNPTGSGEPNVWKRPIATRRMQIIVLNAGFMLQTIPPRLGLKELVPSALPKCKEPRKRRSKPIGQRQPTP